MQPAEGELRTREAWLEQLKAGHWKRCAPSDLPLRWLVATNYRGCAAPCVRALVFARGPFIEEKNSPVIILRRLITIRYDAEQ
jgi:hypothetical protein